MRIENKIVVVGSGYVGMSLATMLSKKHDVTVLDIDAERVEAINQRKPTIKDDDIITCIKIKSSLYNFVCVWWKNIFSWV